MLVNIGFDTVTKKLSASIDGQAMENVTGINIYKRYNDINEDELYMCEIVSCTCDEDNGLRTMTRVSANKIENGLPVLEHGDSLKAVSSEPTIELVEKVTNLFKRN